LVNGIIEEGERNLRKDPKSSYADGWDTKDQTPAATII